MVRFSICASLALLLCGSIAQATTAIDRTTITASASSENQAWNGLRGAMDTLDGDLGLTGNSNLMWMSYGTIDQWIKYDLGAVYNLAEMRVFNFNEYGWTARGSRQVDIQTSATLNGTYTTISSLENIEFAQGKGAAATVNDYTLVTFAENFSAQYIRISVDTSWGGNAVGLSEVQFFEAAAPPPVPEPLTMAALGLGLAGLGTYIRRRTRVS